MNEAFRKRGFTLIELQIGMLASGLLVLSVGLILMYGWISWRESNSIVNMQRDSSLALRALANEIRSSNIADITAGNPLVCVNANGTTRFAGTGGKLVASGYLNMDLVRDGLTSFSSVISNDMVVLSLSLTAGGIVNDSVLEIMPRNTL